MSRYDILITALSFLVVFVFPLTVYYFNRKKEKEIEQNKLSLEG